MRLRDTGDAVFWGLVFLVCIGLGWLAMGLAAVGAIGMFVWNYVVKEGRRK